MGVAPQGAVTYISKGWGGRTSDKFLTEHCDFLDNLIPGDQVLADRGFSVAGSIGLHGCSLHIPDSSSYHPPPLNVQGIWRLYEYMSKGLSVLLDKNTQLCSLQYR